MAQLVLKDIDTETAEKLEMRAKRLGTTPEEEASRLLRERLRAEPLRELATTRTAVKTPAIVNTAQAMDPEMATELKALDTELAALEAASVTSREETAHEPEDVKEHGEIEHPCTDPRFVRKHGFLVFTGVVTPQEIPDHRVLRDERIDTLLQGIDEGRV